MKVKRTVRRQSHIDKWFCEVTYLGTVVSTTGGTDQYVNIQD